MTIGEQLNNTENMGKTAKNVREWLQEQPWYEAFYSNTRKRYWYDERTIKNILNGVYLEETLMAAFNWDCAPEGPDYWEQINLEFMDWFRTQTQF